MVLKPRKRNTLTITINKPVQEVFAFVINPVHSPSWEASITEGEAKDWPPQEGSIFRYKNKEGIGEEFVITSFDMGKAFIMKMLDGNYHVQYTFRPISDTETEVERYEWVIRGMLDAPVPMATLETLKSVLERP